MCGKPFYGDYTKCAILRTKFRFFMLAVRDENDSYYEICLGYYSSDKKMICMLEPAHIVYLCFKGWTEFDVSGKILDEYLLRNEQMKNLLI